MILGPLEMSVPAGDGLILGASIVAIYFDLREDLLQFLHQSLARQ